MTAGKHTLILKRRGNARVELADGLAVTVSPISAADVQLAAAAVRQNLAAAADSENMLARYGLSDGSNGADILAAMSRDGSRVLLAIELGTRHIKSWEGVTLDGETLAPVEPDAIALLLNEFNADGLSYAEVFLAKAVGVSILEPAVKKDSAASPDTSTAAAATTAGSAVQTETPAQTGNT